MHLADEKQIFYHCVYQHYPSVTAWALKHDFKPHNVRMLLAGSSKGIRGEAYKIKRAIQQTIRTSEAARRSMHK
ncbi:hypothetical protein CBG25_14960 [Arsenophonus sp. ENCA]|nr:hypothetical protein CBG25_14960 [Arsenophonus sp. ENCA]